MIEATQNHRTTGLHPFNHRSARQLTGIPTLKNADGMWQTAQHREFVTVRRRPGRCTCEDHGGPKETERQNECDKDFHGEISLSACGAWRNVTAGDI
jgi:hypothetical protein